MLTEAAHLNIIENGFQIPSGGEACDRENILPDTGPERAAEPSEGEHHGFARNSGETVFCGICGQRRIA